MKCDCCLVEVEETFDIKYKDNWLEVCKDCKALLGVKNDK